MPLNEKHVLGKLREVSKLVADLIASIEKSKAVVRPEVAALVRELIRRGYCLSRLHKLDPHEPTNWGMCATHYQTAWGLTKIPEEKGGVTTEFLFQNGWWSEEGKRRGRKPKNATLVKAIAGESTSAFSGLTDEQVIKRLSELTQPMMPTEAQRSSPAADDDDELNKQPPPKKKRSKK